MLMYKQKTVNKLWTCFLWHITPDCFWPPLVRFTGKWTCNFLGKSNGRQVTADGVVIVTKSAIGAQSFCFSLSSFIVMSSMMTRAQGTPQQRSTVDFFSRSSKDMFAWHDLFHDKWQESFTATKDLLVVNGLEAYARDSPTVKKKLSCIHTSVWQASWLPKQ